jgi:ubiquinone/menaquinone biosynthesis C-methylase UbiE
MRRLLRLFFKWLYHPLAFTYDWVAAGVSLGYWKEWGRAILPQIRGPRVLELGHGPGHLQRRLHEMELRVAGLDESRQMGKLARNRLLAGGHNSINLARGLAQSMPFRNAAFDTVLSTFPSEYIFAADTLAEVQRVLAPGGKLIVLPVAWPGNPLLRWLFRATGESPARLSEAVETKLRQPFVEAGFRTEIQILDVKSGILMVVIAWADAT